MNENEEINNQNLKNYSNTKNKIMENYTHTSKIQQEKHEQVSFFLEKILEITRNSVEIARNNFQLSLSINFFF